MGEELDWGLKGESPSDETNYNGWKLVSQNLIIFESILTLESQVNQIERWTPSLTEIY